MKIMKKFLVAAFMAVFAMTANAQFWIGGQAGLGFQNYKNSADITRFTIAPEVGYALNDKWDIAIAIGDEYSKAENSDAMNAFSVNPYVRYTFAKTGKVGFFLDGGFKLTAGDIYYDNNALNDATQWGLSIQPGVKFAATDKLTLVAKLGGIGYRHTQDDSKVYKCSEFGVNANTYALSFGAYFAF